jgi:hypothetical protein
MKITLRVALDKKEHPGMVRFTLLQGRKASEWFWLSKADARRLEKNLQKILASKT